MIEQRKALAASPGHPTYSHLLDSHLSDLVRAAHGMGDVAGEARAERDVRRRHLDPDSEDAAEDAAKEQVLAIVARTGKLTADQEWERRWLTRRAYDKELHATAAALWGGAVEADPKQADDRQDRVRYLAACMAALAGVGRGKDDPAPDEEARSTLRKQALEWLRAELNAWERVDLEGDRDGRERLAMVLPHWKTEADLAGVRDEPELARLSETERQAWRALWADVDSLLARVQA